MLSNISDIFNKQNLEKVSFFRYHCKLMLQVLTLSESEKANIVKIATQISVLTRS